MRMLQSVSEHSSKQSIAHYSSRPTVSQLKGVSDTISKWFENHQPQRTQISTVTNAPFIQNSNRIPSRLTATASFPNVFFRLLQYSRQRPSFLAHRAALMTKTDLTFPAFSLRFVDIAALFCFRCMFSFHEKRRSSQVWFANSWFAVFSFLWSFGNVLFYIFCQRKSGCD